MIETEAYRDLGFSADIAEAFEVLIRSIDSMKR
jgi:hypothetical protein